MQRFNLVDTAKLSWREGSTLLARRRSPGTPTLPNMNSSNRRTFIKNTTTLAAGAVALGAAKTCACSGKGRARAGPIGKVEAPFIRAGHGRRVLDQRAIVKHLRPRIILVEKPEFTRASDGESVAACLAHGEAGPVVRVIEDGSFERG